MRNIILLQTLLLSIISSISLQVQAQVKTMGPSMEEVEKHIDDYQKGKHDGKPAALAIKIADGFYDNHRFDDAVNWYDSALVHGAKLDYVQHDQCLNSMLIARRIDDYRRFEERLQNKKLIDLYTRKVEWIRSHTKPAPANIYKTTLDLGGNSLGNAIFRGQFLYSMPVPDGTYRLALAPITDGYAIGKGELLDGNMKKELAFEGMPSVVGDSLIYYSGNSKRYSVKEWLDKYGELKVNLVRNLELRKARYENGKFQNMKTYFIKDQEHNFATPHVTAGGTVMYFSSDADGGFGNFDLYRCELMDNGKWGNFKNLGSSINTEHNESYPVEFEGYLYFASRGHDGYGGFDLCRVEIKGDSYGPVETLPEPINSSYDDFALVPTSHNSGYLSTNRFDNDGQDRIAYYERKKQTNISVGARDSVINKSVTDVAIQVFQIFEGDTLPVSKGGIADYSELELYDDFEYLIIALRKLDNSRQVRSLKSGPKGDVEFLYGTVIVEFQDVFFEYNKYEITKMKKEVLDKAVEILASDPSIKLEIGGHTDSQGKDKYNLKLSQKRAESVMQYFIDNGIDGLRLVAKGYGESQLKNACSSGVECNEEQHAENRRVHLKVIR